MTDTDHPELVEFEGETLGDTLTNLLAEVKRLRERVKTEKNLKLWEKSEVKRLREKNETFYQSLGPFLRACWKNGGMIE